MGSDPGPDEGEKRSMRIAAAITTAVTLILAVSASAGAAQQYTVAPHDTLYSIARRFGVSVVALAEANGLRDPSRIRAGAVLVIPDRSAAGVPASSPRRPAQVSRSVSAAPPAASSAATASSAASKYVVRPGDTLYSLARTHGLTVGELQDANRLASPDRLLAGQVLRIPAAEVGAAAVPPALEHPALRRPDRASVSEPAPVHPGFERTAVLGRRVTAAAMRYLGTPYAWGGTTPAGVDCSGLVYAVYAPYVPHLGRTSYDQWTAGTAVERADLAPGDLVFFNTDGSGASHVGIYIGDGQFVHPATTAHRVVVDRLDAPYYASHYLGARRVL